MSEFKQSQEWDRCIENALVKTGYGLFGGAVASFILFKNPTARATVTAFAGGAGFGMAYSECSARFSKNSPRFTKKWESASTATIPAPATSSSSSVPTVKITIPSALAPSSPTSSTAAVSDVPVVKSAN